MLTHDEVLAAVRRQCRFNYTDITDSKVLHLVATGTSGWAAAIGQPDWGSYEWVVQPDGDFHGEQPLPPLKSSDCGYGSSTTALRDGLIEAEGCPQIDELLNAVRDCRFAFERLSPADPAIPVLQRLLDKHSLSP